MTLVFYLMLSYFYGWNVGQHGGFILSHECFLEKVGGIFFFGRSGRLIGTLVNMELNSKDPRDQRLISDDQIESFVEAYFGAVSTLSLDS